MTLRDALDQQWSAALASGGGPFALLAASAADVFVCEGESLERLACSARRLALTAPSLAGAPAARLRDVGEGLARRLTYLLEPVVLLETDDEAGVAQLRSLPDAAAGARGHYEILVRRSGEIELRRYEREPGAARRPAIALLTREVVQRLAADFAAAAA